MTTTTHDDRTQRVLEHFKGELDAAFNMPNVESRGLEKVLDLCREQAERFGAQLKRNPRRPMEHGQVVSIHDTDAYALCDTDKHGWSWRRVPTGEHQLGALQDGKTLQFAAPFHVTGFERFKVYQTEAFEQKKDLALAVWRSGDPFLDKVLHMTEAEAREWLRGMVPLSFVGQHDTSDEKRAFAANY